MSIGSKKNPAGWPLPDPDPQGANGTPRSVLESGATSLRGAIPPHLSPDCVADWVQSLRAGDEAATRRLWEQYFASLATLAHRKLYSEVRRTYDGEDAALSAFNSFLNGLRNGRFPDLADPRDLWSILLTITIRKIVAKTRHNMRVKRGGPGIAGMTAAKSPMTTAIDLTQILGREPTPELAAELADEVQSIWSKVTDDSLRSVLLLKLESYTNDEIAGRLECSRRTVQRKLDRIRGLLT